MPRPIQNDDYESDDYEETDTLISRSKSVPRSRSVPRKNTKKSIRRAGSPNKGRPNSSLGKTGHDLWLTALKKRQVNGHSGSPRHKTPIEYWVDTLRKTGTGISTESSGRNTFTGLKKENDLNMAYYSTPHHLRQVMGTEKGKKTPELTNRSSTGTPAYKTPEEYYDEVLELRKQISNLGHDNSIMKAKVRRLEEDKLKKHKEMENLLNPTKSDELRRTIGDRKPDSGAVIHSLKQKILKLEMQLREKDSSYGKLQSELKVTKIDEMKCQMEVLYQELLRLQHSKETGLSKSARVTGNKESTVKVKALNETILRLNKNNEQLEAENRSLKLDLQKAVDGEDVDDGHLTSREYEDMNRKQLLISLQKMEVKMEKLERRAADDNLSMVSLDKSRSNAPGKVNLKGSLEERLQQLDHRETELLDEIAKQKSLINKLKEERLFYKQQYEDIKSPGRNTRASPRRPSTRGSDISRPPTGRRSGSDDEERLRQEKIENLKKRAAANNIQRNWRKHKNQAEAKNEASYMIQGAVRGHHARRQRLSGYHTEDSTEDESLDDASHLIQSNLRGHMGRKTLLKTMKYDSTDDEDNRSSIRRPNSAIGNRNQFGSRRSSRSPRTNHFSGHSNRGSYDEDDGF